MSGTFSGKFIVLDGPDGCGKSTQVEMLAEWLKKQGRDVETYRDPGTTDIGEKIRQILLNPEHIAMSTRTEMLLYMAARSQLWAEKIEPAIENNNKCVILDRWVSSTCAYQGYAGGFGIEKVIKLSQNSLKRLWPDITIILDVDLETSARRMNRKLDRMERKPPEYHQKVREGFLQLARAHENIVVVNAAETIETVHKKILEIISSRLIGNKCQ